MSTLFAEGKAATHLMGSWEYTRQLNQNSDFAKSKLALTGFSMVDSGKGGPDGTVASPPTSTP